MKLYSILAALLFATIVQAQKAKPAYRCLPCGNECDSAVYASGGNCPHCQMELVPAATIRFKEVLPAEVCAYIARNPQTVLLDVRTQAEYEGTASPNFGTLKGALNIPIQELSQRISELEPFKGREILVFCSHSHRSPRAAYLLSRHGFAHVVNLSGGMSQVGNAACKKQ